MGEFWALFARVILDRNKMEPLPPAPVELVPVIRSHRASHPQGLVPLSVALGAVRRPVSLRVGRYLPSSRRSPGGAA